jgi:hypothetical protein
VPSLLGYALARRGGLAVIGKRDKTGTYSGLAALAAFSD